MPKPIPTVEELEKKNAEQAKELSVLSAKNAEQLKQINELTLALDYEKKQREEDNAAALTVIEELKAQLAEGEKTVARLPTIKIGKETYELFGGDFNYKGEIITLEKLKNDSKLAKQLLEEGFGNLRKIES